MSIERKLLPINQVMRAFKEAKGIDADDANWDKKFYKRFIRPAKEILSIFDDNHMRAIGYILTEGSRLDESGLDWGLDAIIRAAGRDYSKIFGGNNGSLNDGSVVADSLSGPGRNRRITPSGEVVSDVLRSLAISRNKSNPPERNAVETSEQVGMGEGRHDLIGDQETFS